MALEAGENKATTVRAGASRAYGEVEATRILVYHVLDLFLSRHLLLQSEHCVMLHGASERGVSDGGGGQPGIGTGAAGMGGKATSPAVAGDSSRGSSGAVLVGESPSMDGGASAGGADQQPSPSTVAGGKEVIKDDRDLLGLTTKIHPPEVRGWCLLWSRVVLCCSFVPLSLAWYEARLRSKSSLDSHHRCTERDSRRKKQAGPAAVEH